MRYFKNLAYIVLQSPLVKVSGATAISTVIKVATNFFSSKVIATYSGPAGIAMLGQLSNIMTIVLQSSTGAINTGVIKYSSEYQSDAKKLRQLIGTSTQIILISTLLTSFAILIFAKEWNVFFFHTTQYLEIIYLLGLATFLFSFNNFFLSIVNGLGQYKVFVKINIVSNIAALVITSVFSFCWQVRGTMIAYVFSQALVFLITLFYVRKCNWIKFVKISSEIHFGQLKNLLKYSLMALISAAVVPSVNIFLRNHVTNELGIEQAGLWEAVNRISSMYLLLITSSVGVYVLPKLSSLKISCDIRDEIIKTYQILLPLTVFILVFVFIFKSWLIPLALSPSFLPILPILYVQLMADFFKIASWILGYNLIAQEHYKTFIYTEIAFSFLYALMGVLSIYHFKSIEGLLWANLINYFFYWLFLTGFHIKKYG